MIDIIMIGLGLSLIMYFYNFAVNAQDMSSRLLACAAMTMEIYFIRRHLKAVKNNMKTNKK